MYRNSIVTIVVTFITIHSTSSSSNKSSKSLKKSAWMNFSLEVRSTKFEPPGSSRSMYGPDPSGNISSATRLLPPGFIVVGGWLGHTFQGKEAMFRLVWKESSKCSKIGHNGQKRTLSTDGGYPLSGWLFVLSLLLGDKDWECATLAVCVSNVKLRLRAAEQPPFTCCGSLGKFARRQSWREDRSWNLYDHGERFSFVTSKSTLTNQTGKGLLLFNQGGVCSWNQQVI